MTMETRGVRAHVPALLRHWLPAGWRLPRWWPVILLPPLGIVLGEAVVEDPTRVVFLMFGGLVFLTALLFPGLFHQLFVYSMLALLAGYAFFGRTFAHLGAPPLFVGELVLLLGFLSVIMNPRRWAALQSPIAWAYLAFASWGALQAIPYLPVYGMDVARDSVLWGYGAFALLIPAFVGRPGWAEPFLERYGRWVPALILWLPVGLLIGRLFPQLLPHAEGSGQLMELVKPGAGGVHLAGAAAFFLLGLHRYRGGRQRPTPLGSDTWLAGACIGAFIAISVFGRGGALATIVGVLIVIWFRPVVAIPRMMLVGGLAVGLASLLLALNVSVELGRRDFSVYQVTSNLVSIFGDAPDDQKNLAQTRDWRLRWWTKIIDYTVHGPYFWTGKGFGVSLPIDDGIKEDTYNRSPHNAHMTVLARTGVPGLALWLLFLATFGTSVLRACLRAWRQGQERWARIYVWLLAYWVAALVAMTFGVYLEGPYGGIWFWSLVGLGIALLQSGPPPTLRAGRTVGAA